MGILRSMVVDYLERSFEREDVAIAYIYCSYKEQENQTATNLISSLVRQLVQRSPVISDELMSLYNCHIKKQTRPTLNEWSTLLRSMLSRPSKVFIVVDALDECTESNGTRNSFLAEIKKLQPSIHLLVTSRHISTIEHEFKDVACVEIRASDTDVRRYVDSRIRVETRLARLIKANPTLQENISSTIVKKAQGMYVPNGELLFS
jgi:NACHT domain